MNDRPAPTVGHSMSFDWTAAYPSRRQPIFARNAVATSQPLATQAGIAVLRAGGNAISGTAAPYLEVAKSSVLNRVITAGR